MAKVVIMLEDVPDIHGRAVTITCKGTPAFAVRPNKEQFEALTYAQRAAVLMVDAATHPEIVEGMIDNSPTTRVAS